MSDHQRPHPLRARPGDDRPTSVGGAVAKFALTGLVAVLIVGAVAALLLRRIGDSEAIEDAKGVASIAGRGIVEPNLPDGLLEGDAAAREQLDRIVRERVLQTRIVRVKLWTRDGRIVYSDEGRLVGARFPLGDEDLEAFDSNGVHAEISDLSEPENRFEDRDEELLEVYLPIHSPDGTPLLFETYLRLNSVQASGRRLWLSFLPGLGAALVALWLVQLPLAWSLARRLRRRQDERERLLRHAVESSELERRRIAADLHDGAVQDLAGTAFALAAAADRHEAEAPDAAAALRHAAGDARRGVRQLRTLLVDIYPPTLHQAGLATALGDLTAPLAAQGVTPKLELGDDAGLPDDVERLLFRVAQESLRNVARHADAESVLVRLDRSPHTVALTIEDDGRGLPGGGANGSPTGHFGLSLLRDLARDAGAELTVGPGGSGGTRVHVEVPA